MESLIIKYEMLSERVRSENLSVDLFTVTVEGEVSKYVSSMELFFERYFELAGEFKMVCPATFETEFHSKSILKFLKFGRILSWPSRQGIRFA